MPTNTLIKVRDVCGKSLDELEIMWAQAKHQAGGGDNPPYGIVMSIFKKKLGSECLKKLEWKESVNENISVGIDLDGTLASYHGFSKGKIGEPISKIVDIAKKIIAAGIIVKIFSARANNKLEIANIQEWCKKYIGKELPVTNIKDSTMVAFFDDRAIQVEKNTGKILGDISKIKELRNVDF